MIVEPKLSRYNVFDYIYHAGSRTDGRKPKIETCGKLFQTLVYLPLYGSINSQQRSNIWNTCEF